jgi:ribonucleoside-diphosphate reductase alpha chain
VGYPHWSTTSLDFSHDVQALLLALGFPTTRKFDTPGWGDAPVAVLRVLNSSYHHRWLDEIGFISGRKHSRVEHKTSQQSARHDHVPVPRALVDRLAPDNDRLRQAALLGLSRTGMVSRTVATRLYERTRDPELGRMLQFFYDRIEKVELGEDELTYDLSVPDNVTYVANGFVSHNTIGLMMDCDTTGIEPDLGLVKMKKLVGGGSMKIVNQTVPVALEHLGYQPEQIEVIVSYIDDHATVDGAPAFKREHLEVFDCAMGERSIAPMGHVRMMAAVQPWISGAISKTVNVPESATVDDIAHVYMEGWRLGLKALAIYRDNCKVAQPLSVSKKAAKPASATDEEAAQAGIVRRRLPRKRPAQTLSFTVGDAEGYMTAGEYPGDGLGEIFVNLGKQGSTLSGVMDAFAISVSIGLQYGVPLEAFVSKFINMRFEPAGMTDDAEVKFASSIVDYMFRRLAIEYLPAETRHAMNIYTMQERTAQLDAGYPSTGAPSVDAEPKADAEGQIVLPVEPQRPVDDNYSNAPMCYQCGVSMVRAGSCHCCPQCGTTSGCS